MNVRGPRAALGAIGLAILAGSGCDKSLPMIPNANQRPVVELTRAPHSTTSRFEYQYRMNWIGHDPDGRIENYLYCIDPPSPTAEQPEPESLWVETRRSEQLLSFRATQIDSSVREHEYGASDFHTFVLKAVDNGGRGGPLHSEPLIRSFYSYTIAPTVQIEQPFPSSRGRRYIPPSIRIRWSGTDPDGILNNGEPVQYKFIMLTRQTAVTALQAMENPARVRDYYAPLHWASWDSTSADTLSHQYTNLIPNEDYVFVVIAIDEAGAYSPIFNFNTNMLKLRVTYAAQNGPTLTVWSDIFFYRYDPPVYSTLPQFQIPVEIGAGVPFRIHWLAETENGTELRGTRWALDIEDLSDETPRANERTDLRRWSQWSALNDQAVLPPFAGGEIHFFYIEAMDNNGLKSLATVRITTVQSTLERPLLVVNDTRLRIDERRTGQPRCLTPPLGPWPTWAELDTFLFARGNVPWRCYDPGTLTSPGLFAGYAFDTLGTRTGIAEVRVPLSKLGRYQNVVWITDATGGLADGYGSDPVRGIGALRYMSEIGRANSLAAYLHQGGNVWLVGGGAAYATLIAHNRITNDQTGTGMTFSNLTGELVPGRFLFDVFKWRSEIKINEGQITFRKDLGRYDSAAVLGRPRPAHYSRLPDQMRPKSLALGDVEPPFAAGRAFYSPYFEIEYLSLRNDVIEDVNPDLLIVDEQSTLDTLYRATGATLLGPAQNYANVCMTRYIGEQNSKVIFTGFDLWSFARVDCKRMVDAVLQDLWLLPYSPPPSAQTAARSSAEGGRRYALGSSGDPPTLAGGSRAAPRER